MVAARWSLAKAAVDTAETIRATIRARPITCRPYPVENGAMERAKRVCLRIAMLVVALNVWTGSPLLALWVGSRVQGSGPPQMGPIAVVVIVFAATSFALATLLARLGSTYNTLTGQVEQVHRHVPWLRSMRGE